MNITKTDLLKRIDNISIDTFQDAYNIDEDIIEFMFDYDLFTDVLKDLEYDDGNYIIEAINEHDLEFLQDHITELVSLTLDNIRIYDYVLDYAEGKIDTYWNDILNWIKNCNDAEYYIEAVITEGLIDVNNYDFYDHVQYAQLEYYRDTFYSEWNNYKNEVIEDLAEYIFLTITEEAK